MKIENQVCALDQAKRLKELGISGPALLYFHPANPYHPSGPHLVDNILLEDAPAAVAMAYNAAELGEMLPSEVATEREPGIEMHVWVCSDEMNYEVAFPADTEAQAKAGMLIWLLEKGHTTAAEANARLAAA